MTRIFITFIFIAWFATSDVFAQRGRPSDQPQVTSARLVEENGVRIMRLPQRNDPAGIKARQIFEAAQHIINPPIEPFSFMQPTDDERKAWFQQAIDTFQTLLVFINPPNEAEIEASPETSPRAPFVPDAFVNAHYLLGKAWVYLNMMSFPDLYSSLEVAEFPKKAADYFEAFIQNGIAENSVLVYSNLANLYFSHLNDPRRAFINIDRCIALEPRDPFNHITRAQILQKEGYLEAACESLKEARRLGETEMTSNLMESWSCP